MLILDLFSRVAHNKTRLLFTNTKC